MKETYPTETGQGQLTKDEVPGSPRFEVFMIELEGSWGTHGPGTHLVVSVSAHKCPGHLPKKALLGGGLLTIYTFSSQGQHQLFLDQINVHPPVIQLLSSQQTTEDDNQAWCC